MGPEVTEGVKADGREDSSDGRPIGSDYQVDPFLARRPHGEGTDDIYDGDW